jgi:hypothetical protein
VVGAKVTDSPAEIALSAGQGISGQRCVLLLEDALLLSIASKDVV